MRLCRSALLTELDSVGLRGIGIFLWTLGPVCSRAGDGRSEGTEIPWSRICFKGLVPSYADRNCYTIRWPRRRKSTLPNLRCNLSSVNSRLFLLETALIGAFEF